MRGNLSIETNETNEEVESRVLEVDPALRRQTPRGGPWIFWKFAGEKRRGLLALLDFCPNPECRCDDVSVQLKSLDPRVSRVEVSGSKLALILRVPDSSDPEETQPVDQTSWSGLVVIPSGVAEPEDGAAPSTRAQKELARWLEKELDGPLLDELHAADREAKGLAPPAANLAALRNSRSGNLVAWRDVFPEARREILELPAGAWLEFDDLHCIDPGCPCTSSTITFSGEDGSLGAIVFDYRKGLITDVLPDEGSAEVLRDSFSRFRERRPDLAKLLRGRAARLKELLPESQPRSAPKIGRNEPCPCGSNRKYKKCCGGPGKPTG